MGIARIAVPVLIAAAALGGCARFEFHSSADLKDAEAGIKFYTPKPYLLVARTGKQDKPVEVSVQYLPDMAHPIYVKANSGWGSANLSLTMADGKLLTFGQQTDTKIPETLTSFASLATALGLRRAEAKAAPDNELQFELYEIDNSGPTTVLKPVTIPR